MTEKIVLTDVDGVLLDWELSFNQWMTRTGYPLVNCSVYHIDIRHNISRALAKTLVAEFNESLEIQTIPALRDAAEVVAALHHKHGYKFRCITSLSSSAQAYNNRLVNLHAVFPPSAIDHLVCLETGACKRDALSQYANTKLYWIEDKVENIEVGAELGLLPILVEHSYNQEYILPPYATRAADWKQVYYHLTGEHYV
jgi:FMN phosphatase YigB (HAD superfamily)